MNKKFLWLKNALAKILGFLGFKSKLDNQAQESNNDLFKDLLDKSKPLRMIKKEEFSDELISKIIGYKNNNKNKNENIKLWVDNASEDLNQALGLKNAKITMESYAVKHIFKRHGIDSVLVKRGQPPITNQDLRDYSSIVNNADIHGIGRGKRGEKALVSGKQINGYHIIVETISKRNNELMLKTMYKENGKLEDSRAIQRIKKAVGLLSSNKRTANSPDAKVNGIGLDSTDATAISNSTTNQPKNQEKPSKLDEAVEELEKAKEENLKERNLSKSQNLTQVNANNSSALDELRREYQESQKQEESKQEHKHQNVRRQK